MIIQRVCVFQKNNFKLWSTPVEYGSSNWRQVYDAAAKTVEQNADAISFDTEGFQVFGNNDKKLAFDGNIL